MQDPHDPLYVPPSARGNGYISRGEFEQFALRMDDRFTTVLREIKAVRGDLNAVIHNDEQGEWLGPRAWVMLKVVTPAVLGGGIAFVVAHFTT